MASLKIVTANFQPFSLTIRIETAAEVTDCKRGSIDVGGSILSGHVNLVVFLGSLPFLPSPLNRSLSSSHFFLQDSHSQNNTAVFRFTPHAIPFRSRRERHARRRKKGECG